MASAALTLATLHASPARSAEPPPGAPRASTSLTTPDVAPANREGAFRYHVRIEAPSALRSLVESNVLEDVYVLTPREAKGLEFDHVVVVEPALIAEEGGERGLRELYVALTRPTQTLVVVHSRDWR